MKVKIDNILFEAESCPLPDLSPFKSEVVKYWKLTAIDPVPKDHPFNKHGFLAKWESGLFGIYGARVNVEFLA